jgi:alcohol dehydrogenase
VTTKRTPVSALFSREAFRLASQSFERVLAAPDDCRARGGMLRAASFAGLAIETSMLGAAHSCANPLTARHGMQHGHAVGLMLPHVVRFNAADPLAAQEYEHLAAGAGLRPAVEALIERIEELLAATSLPTELSECGVPRAAIESLAAEASKQWTAQFNPRSVSTEDFVQLYSQALGRGAAV